MEINDFKSSSNILNAPEIESNRIGRLCYKYCVGVVIQENLWHLTLKVNSFLGKCSHFLVSNWYFYLAFDFSANRIDLLVWSNALRILILMVLIKLYSIDFDTCIEREKMWFDVETNIVDICRSNEIDWKIITFFFWFSLAIYWNEKNGYRFEINNPDGNQLC